MSEEKTKNNQIKTSHQKKELPQEKESKEEKNKKEEVEIPEKFKELIEQIEQMKVGDLAQLVKILEKKFGVSAVAPVVVPSVMESKEESKDKEIKEKSVFIIELKEVGPKKIEVIKAVRDVTQKGLKESKDLVDAVEKEPQVIKENVKKEQAQEIKKKFEEIGAKIELK